MGIVGSVGADQQLYVPSVRPIQHQSLLEMFIIALVVTFFFFEVAKKTDLCLHCYSFLCFFYENKIPVNSCRFYTLSSSEVKFLMPSNCTAQKYLHAKYKVCTKVCTLILTAVKLPISPFFFFFLALNLQRSPGAPSQLGCYQKSTTLAEYLPALSSCVPFSTLN